MAHKHLCHRKFSHKNFGREHIQLEHFGFLKISGVDAVNFLQGYTTCDLAALTDDSAQLGAVCNIQGRMLASFIVIRQGQDLVLRMHKSLVPKTIAFLTKYIVFSKAELADISENLYCYGAPNAKSAASESPYPTMTDNGTITINLGNREEHWTAADKTIVTTGVIERWTDAELDAGIAWVDENSCEAYLPQTLNYHQLGGISFTKGCYLGQEIVARMQYRGKLKKSLHRIETGTQRQGPRIRYHCCLRFSRLLGSSVQLNGRAYSRHLERRDR